MTKTLLEKKYNVQIDEWTVAGIGIRKLGWVAYENNKDIYDVKEICKAKTLAELEKMLSEKF